MSCICRIFNKATGTIKITDGAKTAKCSPTEKFSRIPETNFVSVSTDIQDFKQFNTTQTKQNINTSSTQITSNSNQEQLNFTKQTELDLKSNANNCNETNLTKSTSVQSIENTFSNKTTAPIIAAISSESPNLNAPSSVECHIELDKNSVQHNLDDDQSQINSELNSSNYQIVSNKSYANKLILNIPFEENILQESCQDANQQILNKIQNSNSPDNEEDNYEEIQFTELPQNNNDAIGILSDNIKPKYLEDLNNKNILLDMQIVKPQTFQITKDNISNGNLKYFEKILNTNSTEIIFNNNSNDKLISNEILPNYDLNEKNQIDLNDVNKSNLNEFFFKPKIELKVDDDNQNLNKKEDRDSGVHENEIRNESTTSRISIKQDNEQQRQQTSQDKQQKRLGFIFNRTKLLDNKKDDIIPTHKKDENTRILIRKAIENNDFLNNYMDDERKERVIDAMELIEYDKGKFIIRQNEEGSEIYVSEDGAFDVIKNNEYIDTLGNGVVFGELAILYNAKRFVSIKTASKAKVWKIDRDKFRKIMLISGHKERDENLNFLRSAKYLNDLEEEILLKVVDLLKRVFYPTDCCIVRQGDIGNDFFIIRGGTVTIKKTNEFGEVRVVDRREKGHYFGEQALLNAECRQASVYADAPGTECLKLDRESFISYLGTIPELRETPVEREIVSEVRKSTILNNEYDHIEFDDLKKVAILGAGAFGKVELVLYKDKQSFALKTVKKIDVLKQGQIDHIYSEKKVMSLCHSSSFIVELYRTYRDSKYVYFLMEVCLGGDIWTILYQRKFFDEKTAKFISGCVIEAFDYLHTRNIIYRDLKPENLMLTTDGYCKLVDFGFAKVLNPNHKTNTFAGTPEYVAPEIILDRGHDRAIDYWALGCLIFELLSGGTPFRGTNQMKIYQKILGGIETIKFPTRIQKQAQNLIKYLCRQIPAERLGYQKKGILDIKNHSWYNGFDWNRLQNRSMTSPIPRPITSLSDTQYFPYCNSHSSDEDIPPDDNSGWDINF